MAAETETSETETAGLRVMKRTTAGRLFAKDMTGVKSELTAIRNDLAARTLSRDEVGQLAERRKNAMAIRDVVKDSVMQFEHAALLEEMQRTQEMLKANNTGATSFTKDSISLPRRPSDESTSH